MGLILDIVILPLGFYLTAIAFYLVLLSAASYFTSKPAEAETLPRIAVVIPAHNEERQIESVLTTCFGCRYPLENFEVFVIADNCTDATAVRSETFGAIACARTDPENPGKGQALDWFLRNHQEELRAFEVVTIIDADSQVDPEYLREIAATLADPDADAVQGYHGVSNAEDNWRTALTFAGFAGVNHVRPAGQSVLGGTAGLKGNGMAFRHEILERYGWPAYSIVEDMELSVRLLLDDIRIRYNGDAVVLSEMPTGGTQAVSQRRRWEGGRFQIFTEYGPRLSRAFIASLRWDYLDAFLELLVPPLTLLAVLQLVFLMLSLVFFRLVWLPLAFFSVAATAFYVATALIQRRASPKVWMALAKAPLFILWKIPIYLGLLFKGQKAWVRTTRQAELEQEAPKSDQHDPKDT